MKMTARTFRSVGGSPLVIAAAGLISMFGSVVALAQTADVASAVTVVAPVVPQQVRYTGALASRSGGTVEAVFSIYSAAEGGEALWTETQQVSVGADGVYTVLLGAATERGLPQTVFAAGQARWLGVTVDRAELPRSPLASVAYAMKAGDAETVGGVAAGSLATKDELAKVAQTVATVQQTAAVAQLAVQPEDGPTGSGTMNYVPLWTGAATLGSSGIYQSTAGFVGIGTATPRGPLELDTGSVGGTNSTMNLVQTNGASGNYYASIGLYNTNGLIGNLSALGAGYPSGNLFGANDVVFLGGQQKATTNLIFATNTSGALKLATGGFAPANERMRIGAAGGVSVGNSYVATDPGAGNLIVSGKVGVGTAAPAAVLEVNGTAKFDGLVTFEMGQTFPGTGAGTITGISTTSPLTGSGTTGSVALGLSTSALETTLNGVYAQLGASDTFADAATFSEGLIADQSLGNGYAAVTAQGTSGSIGVYGSSDTGTGVVGGSNSGTGVNGSSTSGSGGVFFSASPTAAAVSISSSGNVSSSSSAYPTALSATATGTDSIGVYGQGTAFGVWGEDLNTGGYAVLGVAADGVGGDFQNNGTDYAAVYVANRAAGTATADPVGVQVATAGINAYGVYSVATGNGAFGLYGESDGTTESGSGRSGIGVKGLGTGADSNGMTADATGTGGYGLYAHASGGSDSKRYASAGVYALANSGIGVEGFAVGESNMYKGFQQDFSTGGVWGDTSGSGENSSALGGIVGTADDNVAGWFVNNSTVNPTLYAYNHANGGTTGLFKVFKASTAAGTCGIGDGDMSCTGQFKALAAAGGGARTVETYATQSAENWMEDYGTGSLAGGRGVVQIDATFADTVTADMSYHVFLTPLGDLKSPLYVTKVSATSFEVHEANGGTSSIGFDYKIVAKRRGFEAQRLVDVTDRFNAEQAETKRRMPPVTNAVASQRVEEPEMVERPASLGRAAALSAAMRTMRPASGPVGPQMPIAPKSAVSPAQKPAVKQ
jgi:hypothetical protein